MNPQIIPTIQKIVAGNARLVARASSLIATYDEKLASLFRSQSTHYFQNARAFSAGLQSEHGDVHPVANEVLSIAMHLVESQKTIREYAELLHVTYGVDLYQLI